MNTDSENLGASVHGQGSPGGVEEDLLVDVRGLKSTFRSSVESSSTARSVTPMPSTGWTCRSAAETYGLWASPAAGSRRSAARPSARPVTGVGLLRRGRPGLAQGDQLREPPHADGLPDPLGSPIPGRPSSSSSRGCMRTACQGQGRQGTAHRAARRRRPAQDGADEYPHEFSGGQRQHRHRPRPVRGPAAHCRRRAGQRPGCLRAGPGDQPPERPAGGVRLTYSSSPTTCRRATHQRQDRRHVPRRPRRERTPFAIPSTPTPARCSPRCRCRTRSSRTTESRSCRRRPALPANPPAGAVSPGACGGSRRCDDSALAAGRRDRRGPGQPPSGLSLGGADPERADPTARCRSRRHRPEFRRVGRRPRNDARRAAGPTAPATTPAADAAETPIPQPGRQDRRRRLPRPHSPRITAAS